ncbi:hypothetical protein SKAU_G00157240 [Synaphobranchus kaupii]|uniref:Uncharacterized protein n=1 Tax=Synaphobranchus kaupii TaxID=118154 RepID=A0A9Q1FI67_SYNKA|nr:hypothetical protein SKAU_G00157240 [Synaphobranchus kaupii]
MDVERSTSSVTVKWLLEEPIVYGARLDITTAATPGLSETLKEANLVTFGQLVNLAGSNLAEAGKLAERLGMRSTRVAGQMLERYKSALTTEDWRALQQGDRGDTDTGEQFPRLLLGPPTVEGSALDSIGGKGLNRLSVEVLNRARLDNRADTPWRANLGMGAETQPAWRDLYRLPLPNWPKERNARLGACFSPHHFDHLRTNSGVKLRRLGVTAPPRSGVFEERCSGRKQSTLEERDVFIRASLQTLMDGRFFYDIHGAPASSLLRSGNVTEAQGKRKTEKDVQRVVAVA